jgi:hypothetical protein
MPDLSHLNNYLIGSYFLNRVLGGAGFQTPDRSRAFFLNLVRLTDKTLGEYEETRTHLQRYVDSPNKTSLLLKCTGHMENCIDSLHRLFKHASKLRNRLHTLEKETGQPVPKLDWKKLPKKKETDRIEHIRHAIQHMDDRISEGKAGEGISYIGLHVMSDSIELEDEIIYHRELAAWTQQVHKVAEQLVAYVPTAS